MSKSLSKGDTRDHTNKHAFSWYWLVLSFLQTTLVFRSTLVCMNFSIGGNVLQWAISIQSPNQFSLQIIKGSDKTVTCAPAKQMCTAICCQGYLLMAAGAFAVPPVSQWGLIVTFPDHTAYVLLTLAWSSEDNSSQGNCASSHIFCALFLLRVNNTEKKLGSVLNLHVPFCFRSFFLRYLEFSICLQWKRTRIPFHPGYWPTAAGCFPNTSSLVKS